MCDESRCQEHLLVSEAREGPTPGTFFLTSFHQTLASKQQQAPVGTPRMGGFPSSPPVGHWRGDEVCVCMCVNVQGVRKEGTSEA